MAVETRWVAIIGGPSSGKSTLREALSIEGYDTRPDAARVYIQFLKSEGKSLAEIREDPLRLEEEIFELKVRLYEGLDPDRLTIIDCPIEDCDVYYEMGGGGPGRFRDQVNKWRYAKVFFCEASVADMDGVRIESFQESKKIGGGILKLFRGLGYDPTILKAEWDADKRLGMVLEELRKLGE